MNSFTSEELKEELIKRGIHEDDAQILFEENVDGNDFMSITNDDLKELKLKLGNRKKLLSIIEFEKNINTPPASYTVIPHVEEEIDSPQIVSIYQQQLDASDQATSGHMARLKYSKPETIPVLDSVKASERGKKILKCLENGKIITQSDVREIIRSVLTVAVRDLHTMYPTFEQKVNIAKAVVMAIPQLKNSRADCEGYEQFYDPHLRVGMIEWRLKTMRLSLTPSRKKYTKRKQPTSNNTFEEEEDDDGDDDMEDKITWLMYEIPSEIKRTEIFATMAETFKIRRKFINKNSPSITEILNRYPKLKEFQGELIEVEFSTMHPKAESFLGKFPSHYTQRIIKYCKETRMDIYDKYDGILNENLSACLMLSDLLPTTGLRRRKLFAEKDERSKNCPSEHIIRFPGENIDFSAIEKTFDTQPFLICQGDKTTDEIKFFLHVDSSVIDVGCCPIRAVDILYKSHYVFNVKYSRACETFYMFLDFMLYNMKKGPARSSIESLNILLNRLNM